MVRRVFVPTVVIVALALIALLGVTSVVAWKTSFFDSYLPQTVRVFFGKEYPTGLVPQTSDTQEPSGENSQTTTADATKDWKTYTNTELGFSFKYPINWKKNQTEADIEVVLLESEDGGAYMNFYKDGAFGGEPGWEVLDTSEKKVYYTTDGFQVNAEVVYTGRGGEVVVSGSFYPRLPGLTFTYVFDRNLVPDGLDVSSLILSTFKFL